MPSTKLNTILLGFLAFLVLQPCTAWAQKKYWTKTIDLQDRRDGGLTPVVAKVTFAAYSMTEPTSPGQPILAIEEAGVLKVDPIQFTGLNAGYIKFKITSIDWSPAGKEFDGSSDYKVIVRNVWVDMSPQIYIEKKKKGGDVNLRKRYITAPNVEYIKGDSLPPPTIFKVDRNSNYRFTVGVKAVTPKTTEEKPFQFPFDFTVTGLEGKDIPVETPVVVSVPIDTGPKTPIVKVQVVDNGPIDDAVRIAIENEDVDALLELIRENPTVPSARNARAKLALKMTKELIDSTTYRIDVRYAAFTRAVPTKEEVNLSYSHFGTAIGEDQLHPQWRDGKLFVRPPKDNTDYAVTATHKVAPENKATIALNSVKDYITFTYQEVAEDKVEIKVKGGHGPYRVYLQRQSGGDYFDIEGSFAIFGDTVLQKEKMARSYVLGEEGDFRLFLVDAEQLKKTGSGTVHLVPPPPIPPIVWYIAIGVLALFLIAFLFYRREKNRKDEELEKLLAERGGSDPRVKRKPRPELERFWKETAISELSLHKNFVRDVSTYLKERPHVNSEKPMIEGILMGTVLKFDFEKEQYEVRLDRFRAVDRKPLDYYEERGDDDKWADLREVAQDHRDMVKIGWLQVAEGRPMRLGKMEQQFQDEQFSELFQLHLKIDIVNGKRLCCFFTRTTSGKMNNVEDRLDADGEWLDWDALEEAGYYESSNKIVREEGGGKIKVKMKDQETA